MNQIKRILYFSPLGGQFASFLREIEGVYDEKSSTYEDGRCFVRDELCLVFYPSTLAIEALSTLHTAYMNLLLIDLRWSEQAKQSVIEQEMEQVRELLFMLDNMDDMEARYGFHRIVVLVSGPDPEHIDRWMVELGRSGIQTVLRERPDPSRNQEKKVFLDRLFDQMMGLMLKPRRRKRALCLAGGGITGIYYELAALKCLNDCMFCPSSDVPAVNDFDMVFGISAGAVVGGVLAMGYSVEEFMAAIAGVSGGRLPVLTLNVLQLQNLNVPNMMKRLKLASQSSFHSFWGALKGDHLPRLDEIFLEYSEAVGPPFHSENFEKILRRVFEYPGATNNFRELKRPQLFVGASDQDVKRHVLFGAKGFEDVPISQAIQASLSIHPAFSSVELNGRFYEDGAVTQTSHFGDAIQRDASLVMVLDPFLPFVSHEPGYTEQKGLLYNMDQGIRTLSFTRYESMRNWALRKHPDISSYTFVPSNRTRKLLSNNPMDHRPYLDIWKEAYLSTFRRICTLSHRLHGDLDAHGWALDLSNGEKIADQLEEAASPRFEDFFLEGIVSLPHPPLTLEH